MCRLMLFCVFLFKQKTAYEMRISDWSSDVCSSDLQRCASVEIEMGPNALLLRTDQSERCRLRDQVRQVLNGLLDFAACDKITQPQIGRASCRERVCQYG